MPWRSRGHSNSRSNSKPTQNDSSTPAGSTPAGSTSDPLYGPSSYPDFEIPTLHPSRPRPETANSALSHSRSFSHPFPSFLGRKRSDKKHGSKQESLVFDSTDEEVSYGRVSGPQRVTGHTVPNIVEKEPVTGKCMTCDSTVRWPQGLKVFRCTICLTINDLEPFLEVKSGAPTPGKRPTFSVPRRPLPVSIDRTRHMIDRCLDEYLQIQLHDVQDPGQFQASPPISPEDVDQDMPEGFFNGISQDLPYTSHDNASPLNRATSSPLAPSRPRFKTRSPSDSGLSSRRPSHSDLRGSETVSKQPHSTSKLHTDLGRRPSHGDTLEVPDHLTNEWQPFAGSDTEATRKAGRNFDYAIFRPLENYLSECFMGCASLNSSFLTARPSIVKAASEGSQTIPMMPQRDGDRKVPNVPLSEMDAKTLLIGDFAENGSWWTGNRPDRKAVRKEKARERSPDMRKGLVTSRSPRIQWDDVDEWYELIVNAGNDWLDRWLALRPVGEDAEARHKLQQWKAIRMEGLEKDILRARTHAQRALLKMTENLLKRPRRPLKHAEDCRFLFLLLANPLLYSSTGSQNSTHAANHISESSQPHRSPSNQMSPSQRLTQKPKSTDSGALGHHAGIVKRILGLVANVSNEIHHFLVAWLSRLSDDRFQKLVDMVGSFVTYRLTRQHRKARSEAPNPTAGLVPSFSSLPATSSSAQLHDALGTRPTSSRKGDNKPNPAMYGEDWQIRAAARVMALLFAANSGHTSKKRDVVPAEQRIQSAGLNAKHAAHAHGQIVPISNFYNTMLDYADLVADFTAWESKRGKFSFCQYPFFLSIWAKIHIMEHDARRQMEVRAREAFFDSILSRKAVSQYLVLKVRRDCLVEDSLQSVSEVIGSGDDDEIKKGLRIDFVGEEGVDAGGLRKEWFLLLVREIFDPHHGLFVYDDESHFCYFNPHCFESSEQFFLVGVLLGLAIYNSTILDVAFPPFAFKKLLASAPTNNILATTVPRLSHTYTLEDLAEFRPALARGLRALIEFDGDVQEVFCRNFVADVNRYGEVLEVPLCPGGERKPVTNSNRREFVDLYIQYLLETQVSRQYEPFKRGFFTVCGGNALSLFRPEEIELLVRGSDEPLDIASLRAVAVYEGWHASKPETEPCVQWFWSFFEGASPKDQRRILSFITGSDRIPAMGATNLVIKVACLENVDSQRLPMARTCFNMVGLYRYSSQRKMEEKLWMAVSDSEGFGLK